MADERVEELRARLQRMGEAEEQYTKTIGELEVELRVKRGTITKLRNELERTRQSHKRKPEADEVFAFWKAEVAPKAREFSGDRLKHVLARLEAGYTVDELKDAILGAKVGAFTNEKGVTYDDLELICRSASKVDSFRKRWEAHTRREAVSQRARPNGRQAGPDEPTAASLPAEEMIDRAVRKLQARPKLMARLTELKGWTPEALLELRVGWDGVRLWLPVYDRAGDLVNVLRYSPAPHDGKPKLLARKGRKRDLFPAPERLSHRGTVFIVEGETDAIAARSIGLPAVGLPGVKWQPDDGIVGRFYGVEAVVVMLDCDEPGRKRAQALAEELPAARVIDLDPNRDDGFDLSDYVADGGTKQSLWKDIVKPQLAIPKVKVTRTDAKPKPQVEGEKRTRIVDHDPVVGVLDALERHRCSWKVSGRDQWQCQCPAHEDRQASLSLRQVVNGTGPKVLVNCFAGCTAQEVIQALDIPWGALFGSEIVRG